MAGEIFEESRISHGFRTRPSGSPGPAYEIVLTRSLHQASSALRSGKIEIPDLGFGYRNPQEGYRFFSAVAFFRFYGTDD
jgi:hypothetical protein